MIIYSKASLNEIKDRVAPDAYITPSYNGYGAAGNRLDLSSLNGVIKATIDPFNIKKSPWWEATGSWEQYH